MASIFMSYAREDNSKASLLAHGLEAQGWSVFWDRTIPSGQTWRTFIGKALEEAQCVIVGWSASSIESHWVHEEADDARQRHILVPVLFESVIPPIGFRSIQAADLADWDGDQTSDTFRRLVADISEVLARLPQVDVEKSKGDTAAGNKADEEESLQASPQAKRETDEQRSEGDEKPRRRSQHLLGWATGGAVIGATSGILGYSFFRVPEFLIFGFPLNDLLAAAGPAPLFALAVLFLDRSPGTTRLSAGKTAFDLVTPLFTVVAWCAAFTLYGRLVALNQVFFVAGTAAGALGASILAAPLLYYWQVPRRGLVWPLLTVAFGACAGLIFGFFVTLRFLDGRLDAPLLFICWNGSVLAGLSMAAWADGQVESKPLRIRHIFAIPRSGMISWLAGILGGLVLMIFMGFP